MEKFKVGDKVYINEEYIGQKDWYKAFREQYPLGQRVFVIKENRSGWSILDGDVYRYRFIDNWLVPASEPVTEKPKTIRMAVDILKYANEMKENRELDDTERFYRLFGYIEATAREEQRG